MKITEKQIEEMKGYQIVKVCDRIWHTAEIQEGYEIHKDGKALRHLVVHTPDTRKWYEKLYKKHLPAVVWFDTLKKAQEYIENRTTELPENEVMTYCGKELASDAKTLLKPKE